MPVDSSCRSGNRTCELDLKNTCIIFAFITKHYFIFSYKTKINSRWIQIFLRFSRSKLVFVKLCLVYRILMYRRRTCMANSLYTYVFWRICTSTAVIIFVEGEERGSFLELTRRGKYKGKDRGWRKYPQLSLFDSVRV